MAVVRAQKNKQRAIRVAYCAVMYTLLFLFLLTFILVSENYSEMYHSPKVQDGKADFEGIDLPARSVACNLGGEWDFFYNKWIVTDDLHDAPDGKIKIPSAWTYKNFGSGVLPKTGYASYRLIVENVQPDIYVTVSRHYCNFAYRVFINGQLNYQSGELSKVIKETAVTGATDAEIPFMSSGEPMEIVIEISATKSGGFSAAPWLSAKKSAGQSYGNSLRTFNYIALGITTAAVAISILSFLFFRYKRDVTVPAFMTALYIHFLFSKDMLFVTSVPIRIAIIMQLISAITAFILLVAHFARSGAVFKKIPLIATAAGAAVAVSFAAGFYLSAVSVIFAFIAFVIGCAYLIPIAFNRKATPIQNGLNGALFILMMSVFGFELLEILGLLVFGTEFIFTFELMFIIACFAALWLWKLADTARTAIRVTALEYEMKTLKNKALKAQIKPHFIYNSLTAIQSRYRDGLNEGDKAIEQFASHLRLITDTDGDDLISFDNEIRNVLNYFELENLRSEKKLGLLLDLAYTDFSVPVLSLQPLVENAIKHGELEKIPDGYIQLSCEKTDDEYIEISVSDNGKGFDVNKKRNGVGLENVRKRFELIGAEMYVDSRINCGTQIKIKIPMR